MKALRGRFVLWLIAPVLMGALLFTLYQASSARGTVKRVDVAGRTETALCVDSWNVDVNLAHLSQSVKSIVNDRIVSRPDWTTLGYTDTSVRVDVGCPSIPYLLLTSAGHPTLNGSTTLPPVVIRPSPYRAHIVVVPTDQINRIFKRNLDVRIAPEELVCEDDECTEVTLTLYLSQDDLSSQDELERRLLQALGIIPAYPPAPVPADLGRGVPHSQR